MFDVGIPCLRTFKHRSRTIILIINLIYSCRSQEQPSDPAFEFYLSWMSDNLRVVLVRRLDFFIGLGFCYKFQTTQCKDICFLNVFLPLVLNARFSQILMRTFFKSVWSWNGSELRPTKKQRPTKNTKQILPDRPCSS